MEKVIENGLTVYGMLRLSQLDGPFGVIGAIRERIAKQTNIVECPYCLGFWLCLLVTTGMLNRIKVSLSVYGLVCLWLDMYNKEA